MLDTLIIHIPLRYEFVTKTGDLHNVKGDLMDYQVKAVPSYIKRDFDTNEIIYGDLKHPFESLPTSFGSMAIKIFHTNVRNTRPYISLNASPKILQGHNVYGGDCVLNLASEMLYLLFNYYPAFYACLDINSTEISRLDFTYSASLPSVQYVKPFLDYVSNISNGHRKVDDRRDYYNTVYFGGSTSRYGYCKIYGKFNEVVESLKKYQKSAKMGDTNARAMLNIFNRDLLKFTENKVRFEATAKKRLLRKLQMPTNLWQFIKYQKINPDVSKRLWHYYFDAIFETFDGDIDMNTDDNEIYNKCLRSLWKQNINKDYKKIMSCPYFYFIVPSFDYSNCLFSLVGKISYTPAQNAFNFYKLIKIDGYSAVKDRYNRRTFNHNVSQLSKIGFKRSYLQTISTDIVEKFNVHDLINVDFSNQYPKDAKIVLSSYISYYKKYINDDTIDSGTVDGIPIKFIDNYLPDDNFNHSILN